MNCLVIGCGSMGRRHIKNLLNLGHKVWAHDIDKSKIPTDMSLLDNFSYGEVRDNDIEAVFICTPSNRHHMDAQLWRHKHLFVEKPLTSNKELGIYYFRNIWHGQRASERINLVACNMRFEPLLQEAYRLVLIEKAIGELLSVKVDYGYDITKWNTDGKLRADIPGVVLDCIHELDLLQWFHGKADSFKAICQKGIGGYISIADIVLQFDSVVANLHMDYCRREKKRVIEWVGTEGTVTYEETLSLRNKDGYVRLDLNDEIVTLPHIDDAHNYPYLKQLEHFLECVEKGIQTCNPIEEAMETTKLALRIQDG